MSIKINARQVKQFVKDVHLFIYFVKEKEKSPSLREGVENHRSVTSVINLSKNVRLHLANDSTGYKGYNIDIE